MLSIRTKRASMHCLYLRTALRMIAQWHSHYRVGCLRRRCQMPSVRLKISSCLRQRESSSFCAVDCKQLNRSPQIMKSSKLAQNLRSQLCYRWNPRHLLDPLQGVYPGMQITCDHDPQSWTRPASMRNVSAAGMWFETRAHSEPLAGTAIAEVACKT
jgi:hypothetical protein